MKNWEESILVLKLATMFGNCTLQRNCLANFTHICTKQKLSVSTKTSFAQQVENRICASVTSGGSRILERGFQFLAKAPALEDQKRRSSTFILPALSAMCDAFSLHASFPINFCSILWKPYLLKDSRQLEQLQHWATKCTYRYTYWTTTPVTTKPNYQSLTCYL